MSGDYIEHEDEGANNQKEKESSGNNRSDRIAEYDATMEKRAKAVRIKAKNVRNRLQWFAVFCIAVVWIVVVNDNVFHSKIELKYFAAVPLLAWIGYYSKYIIPTRINLTCPNCKDSVNFNQDWICGWCDDEKSSSLMQILVSYRVPLEACKACEEVAHSVECPHCEKPIIFDFHAYNNEKQIGEIKPGLARMM